MAMAGLHPLRGEEESALTLPAELLPTEPTLAAEQNGLVALLDRLKAPDQATKKSLQEALTRIRSGESVKDSALIQILQERHEIAAASLKAPVQCPRTNEFSYLTDILLPLYQGIEVLSWHSFSKGDQARATRYLEEGLEWSDLIRNGNPTLLEASFASTGWHMIFHCTLSQWELCDNQKASLGTIERLFREHRMSSTEYVAVFKRESQYWIDCGGTKAMLQNHPPDTTLESMLRKPFSSLTAAQVLELPYDPGIEARNLGRIRSRILKHLRAGDPLDEWPKPEPPEHEVTIEDYRRRPNGLGDLLDEQTNGISEHVITANLLKDPAIATCIAWLKAEGEGREFRPGDPGIARDPVDGKPLRIDTGARLIKSIASDRNSDASPETLHFSLMIEVPEWRAPD